MMFALWAVFFIINAKKTSAQAIFSDTTYNRISKIQNDSLRKEQLLGYVEKQISNKSSKAIKLQEDLEKKALQKNDLAFLGRIYGRFGFAYLSIGAYVEAFPKYIKALDIYDKVDDPARKIRVYQDMMWIQLQLKDYKASKDYLDKALVLAKADDIKAKEGEIYNFYGIFYDSQNKFKEAIEFYRKALVLNKIYGNKYNEISTLTNLGISLRRLKQYPEALIELEKAAVVSDEVNHPYYKQSTAQNLAELTFEMNNYELAEKYILEALAFKKSNEFVLKRGLFQNLEKIYKKKGDYQKANQYADSIIAVNESVFDDNRISEIRNLQSKYDLVLKDKKNSEQQLVNLKQATEIDNYKRIVELKEQQQKINNLDFKYQQKQSDLVRKYQERVIQRNKLIATKDKNIAERKLNEEHNKMKTVRTNQFILFGVVIGVSIFTILLLFNFERNRRLNRVIVAQKNELEKSNMAKDKIFSIVGHDLRSPFNTLKSFTHLIDDDDVNEANIKKYSKELKGVLGRTSILLDNILNWSNSQMQGYLPRIKDESIHKIIDVQVDNFSTEAFNKNIAILNDVPDDLIIETDANMLSVIIRNLLSNAIKFSHPNGKIKFWSDVSEHHVFLKLKDDGVGVSQKILDQFNSTKVELSAESTIGTNRESGTGLGLYLIKSFSELINAEIRIDNSNEEGEGTTFILKLPLKQLV